MCPIARPVVRAQMLYGDVPVSRLYGCQGLRWREEAALICSCMPVLMAKMANVFAACGLGAHRRFPHYPL